jgi:hypothetical protein
VQLVDADGNYLLVENLQNSQNVVVGIAPATAPHVIGGLAGEPDGDRTNEFTLRDGARLTFAEARTTPGLYYGRLAGTWRVRPSEGLFTLGRAERCGS